MKTDAKKEAQITVHKFWNTAKRQVEMNIVAYRIAVTHVRNLRQTVELKVKKKKRNIAFDFEDVLKFQKRSSSKSSLNVFPLVTQLLD